MEHYIYNGPILSMNKVVKEQWQGETQAMSDKKAKANLCYQFKKEYGLAPTANITLSKMPSRV